MAMYFQHLFHDFMFFSHSCEDKAAVDLNGVAHAKQYGFLRHRFSCPFQASQDGNELKQIRQYISFSCEKKKR